MKRGKQLLALFLAILIFATSDSYLYQVLAEDEIEQEEVVDSQLTKEEGVTVLDETSVTSESEVTLNQNNLNMQEVSDKPQEKRDNEGNTFAITALVTDGVGTQDNDTLNYVESIDALEAGKRFTYQVEASYNSSGGTSNLSEIQLKVIIPEGLTYISTIGEYLESQRFGLDAEGNRVLTVNLRSQSTGFGAPIKIVLETTNYTTKSGTVYKDGTQGSLGIIPTMTYILEGQKYESVMEKYPSVTVVAEDRWEVKKTAIGGEDNEQGISVADIETTTGDYFVGAFNISIDAGFGNDEIGSYDEIDAPGQRAVTNFKLVDTIHANYKANGRPIGVKNVFMGSKKLNENSDYKLIYGLDQETITGIQFITHEVLPDGSYNYANAGQMAKTSYTYEVLYEKEGYIYSVTSDVEKTLVTNTAKLSYIPYGETREQISESEAGIKLGIYESDVAVNSVKVVKYIEYDGIQYLMTRTNAAGYGLNNTDVTFSVYNTNGTPALDAKTGTVLGTYNPGDTNGEFNISNLKIGETYILRETVNGEKPIEIPPSTTKPSVLFDGIYFTVPDSNNTVTIDANGYSADVLNGAIKVVNKVAKIGGVEFVKKGLSADGTYVTLAGVKFALVDVEGNEYLATSNANGQVSFVNIPIGNYKLYEVELDNEKIGLGDYETIKAPLKMGKIPSEFVIDYSKMVAIADVSVINGIVTRPTWDHENYYINRSNKGKLEIIKWDHAEQAISSPSGKEATFLLYGPLTVEEIQKYENNISSITDEILEGWDKQSIYYLGNGKYAPSATSKAGGYIVKEVKAPLGYQIEGNGLSYVKVVPSSTTTVGIKNTARYPVRFLKYGIDYTGTRVDGLPYFKDIRFDVYEGKKANPDVTNEDDFQLVGGNTATSATISKEESGKAVSHEMGDTQRYDLFLELGKTYYYKEVNQGSNYLFEIKEEYVAFTVARTDNGIFTVEVQNDNNAGKIEITKVDGDDKKPLSGAQYSIFLSDKDKNKIGSALVTGLTTTGNDGHVLSDYLKAGEFYIIEETEAPDGYALANEVQHIGPLKEEINRVTFENFKTYTLKVLKEDQKNTPLSGAIFQYSIDGGITWHNLLSGSGAGEFTLQRVLKGEAYSIRESRAPSGYMGVDDFTATIGSDAVINKNVTQNWDEISGTQTITVKNSKLATVTLTKQYRFNSDTYTNYFDGAKFTLLKKDLEVEGELINSGYSKTTDGNGTLRFENLPIGETFYILEEEIEGYKLSGIEGTEVRGPHTYTYQGETISCYSFTTTEAMNLELLAKNDANKSKIEVEKIGVTSESTKVALEGVPFKLQLNKGSSYNPDWEDVRNKNGQIITGVTNKNGYIDSDTFGWLAKGAYRLVETLPDGYVYDETDDRATLSDDEKYVYYMFDIADSDIGKLVTFSGNHAIKNIKTGSLKVEKYGKFVSDISEEFTEIELLGATFALYQYDGAAPNHIGAIVGDEFTMARYSETIKNLTPGKYVLKEISAPNNYKIEGDGIYEIVVPIGEEVIQKVYNLPDGLGIIHITKTDTLGNIIRTHPAAQFTSYQKVEPDSDEYKAAVQGGTSETLTDGNGDIIYLIKVSISESAPGNDLSIIETSDGTGVSRPIKVGDTYYFKETQEPDGYVAINLWTGPVVVEEGRNDLVIRNQREDEIGHELDEQVARLQVEKLTAVVGKTLRPVQGVKYFIYQVQDENFDEHSSWTSLDYETLNNEGVLSLVGTGYTNDAGLMTSVLIEENKWYIVREANPNEYLYDSGNSNQESDAPERVEVGEGNTIIVRGEVTEEKVSNHDNTNSWVPIYVGTGTTVGPYHIYPTDVNDKVTFVNPAKIGAFSLRKEVTGETKDISFTFKLSRQKWSDAGNLPVENDENWEEYKTITVKNGETIISDYFSTDYVYKLEEIVPADLSEYYFEETSKNPLVRIFMLSAGKIIGVEDNLSLSYQAYDNEAAAISHPILYTNLKKAKLHILKQGMWVDESGKVVTTPLTGVQFKIYSDPGHTVEIDYKKEVLNVFHETKATVVSNGYVTTDNRGEIRLWMRPGTYYFKEIAVGVGNEDKGFDVPKTENFLGGLNGLKLEYGSEYTDDAKIIVPNVSSYGRFKALKVDGNDNTKKLQNAVFEIYTKNNLGEYERYTTDTLKSDANGVILSMPLPEDAYYLKEITAPGVAREYDFEKGFLGPFMVELSAKGEPQDVTEPIAKEYIKNWKNFEIKVTKKNAAKTPLAGVSFDLYDNETDAKNRVNKLAQGTTSDTDGVVTFDQLFNLRDALNNEHNYYLVETMTADGYVALTEPIEVTISYDDIKAQGKVVTYNIDVENIKGPTILLHKVGDLKNASGVDDTTGLEGVTFKLRKVVGFAGGVPLLSTESAEATTNQYGNVAFDKLNGKILEVGQWYALCETKVPDEYQGGFDAAMAPYYYFQAENADYNNSEFTVVQKYYTDIVEKSGVIEGVGQPTEESIKNTSGMIRLNLYKKDGNKELDDQGKATALDSAYFALFKKDTDGSYKPYTQDNFASFGANAAPEKGYFHVTKSGYLSGFFMPKGEYILIELSKNMDTTTYDNHLVYGDIGADLSGMLTELAKEEIDPYAEVNVNGQKRTILFEPSKEALPFIIGDTELNTPDGRVVVTAYNRPLGELKVTKYGDMNNNEDIDAGDKLLEGVKFELTYPNSAKNEKITGNLGNVIYSELSIGDYTLEESQGIDTFIKGDKVQEISIGKIADDNGGMRDITLWDINNDEKNLAYLFREEEMLNLSSHGYIKVIKTDKDGKLLPLDDTDEIEFEIYKENSSNEYEAIGEKILINKQNNSLSGVYSKLLKVGNYKLKETKTKYGYELIEGFVKGNDGQDLVIRLAPYQLKDDALINAAIITNTYYDGMNPSKAPISKQVSIDGQNFNLDEVSVKGNLVDYKSNPEDGNVSVHYKVLGYGNGTNDFELKDFTVEDGLYDLSNPSNPLGGIKFYDKDDEEIQNTVDNGIVQDYAIHSITIEKAWSGLEANNKYAGATVYATTDGTTYNPVGAQVLLNQQRNVTLPNNTIGVKVIYDNVGVAFYSGGFEMNVTFCYRGNWDAQILKKLETVMSIGNKAKVSYTEMIYHALDEEGKPVMKDDNYVYNEGVSNEPMVRFDIPDNKLAKAEINCEIPSEKDIFTAGQEIEYKITASVPKDSQEALYEPVIAFRMPLDTALVTNTINDHKLAVQWLKENGSVETLTEGVEFDVITQNTYNNDAINAVIGITDGVYQEKLGTITTQYILRFNKTGDNEVTIKAGDKITVEFNGKISYDTKAETDNLVLIGYLGSLHTVLPDASNPLGTSFLEANNSQTLKVEDTIGNALDKEMEYVKAYVKAGVENGNSMAVTKSVGTTFEQAKSGNTENVPISSDGKLYYKLTIYNNTQDDMEYARFIDILPAGGDTMTLQSSKDRNTTIPKTSEGKGKLSLVDVSVNQYSNKNDRDAVISKVYAYDEGSDTVNSWENRGNDGKKLSMLSDVNADWIGSGWTELSGVSDKNHVSAVGIEIQFPGSLKSGDSMDVYVTVQTPQITEELIELYRGKNLKNSVVGALIEKNRVSGSIGTALKAEPDSVTAEITLPTGGIGDYVWHDQNGNGLQDIHEPGIENARVELYQTRYYKTPNENIIKTNYELLEACLTNSDGFYSFDNLQVNALKSNQYDQNKYSTNPDDYIEREYFTYHIRVILPDNVNLTPTVKQVNNSMELSDNVYLCTYGDDEDSDINIDGTSPRIQLYYTNDENGGLIGEYRQDLDAGYANAYAIGNYVWEDENADGIQSIGENGVKDVAVNLYQVDDKGEVGLTPIARTNTDVTGYYLFKGLMEGRYVVEYDISMLYRDRLPSGELPYKYMFTTTDLGNDDTKDSDAKDDVRANGRVRRTDIIELNENTQGLDEYNRDLRWDAGVVQYSSLGGYAFDDKDYDNCQVQTTSLIPLIGTQVMLYRLDGTKLGDLVGTTTIDKSGQFLFEDLLINGDSDDFTILFTLPDGYRLVVANQDSSKDNGTSDATPGVDSAIDSDALPDGTNTRARITKITLPKATKSVTWAVGARLFSSIGDYVWEDTNKNGYQDVSEKGVGNILVALQERENNSSAWKTHARAYTTANGYYEFEHLESSSLISKDYRVVFMFGEGTRISPQNVTQLKDGTKVTTATDSDASGQYFANIVDDKEGGYVTKNIKPEYGKEDKTWDVGIYYPKSSIRGIAWHDSDFTGKRDDHEAMFAGVLVSLEMYVGNTTKSKKERDVTVLASNDEDLLRDAYWMEIASMTTGNDGAYEFLDLDPGYYRLKFTFPEGYTATRYNNVHESGGENFDSDASRPTGDRNVFYSKHFYLEEEVEMTEIDAGLYDPKEIVNRIPEYQYSKRTITQGVPNYVVRRTGTTNAITKAVRTGDASSRLLWAIIMLSSLTIAGAGVRVKKKRKNT